MGNRSMNDLKSVLIVLATMAWSVVTVPSAVAAEPHKVVIQISSADPKVHRLAIDDVENLLQIYGTDNVKIELVAHGPGLRILTRDSAEADRIKEMARVDSVTLNACAVTMAKMEKTHNKVPALIDGVNVVPAGLPHIIDLEEQGYAYVLP